jgi:hypothetical protein
MHPSGFRKRFSDEMLSIFDESAGKSPAIRLLMDGIVSLLRQWTLRSDFWHNPSPAPQPIPDGIPSFSTLDPFRPRASAVINGLVLSMAVFCLTCLAIRYSGFRVPLIHIPEVQFESRLPIQPNARTAASVRVESPALPLTPENSRLIETPAESHSAANLTPQAPPASRAARNRAAKSPAASSVHTQAPAAQSAIARSPSDSRETTQPFAAALSSANIPLNSLQSCVGTYIAQSPDALTISITAQRGHLAMRVADQPRRELVQVSETKFLVRGMNNSWIEFSADNVSTEANSTLCQELHLFQKGQHITAQRQ